MVLENNKKVYTVPLIVANVWADYYEKLAMPTKVKQYEQMEAKITDILLKSKSMHDYVLGTPITLDEIWTVVNNLLNGNAPGTDCITYEHLKYGGKLVIDALLKFYSLIIEAEQINRFRLSSNWQSKFQFRKEIFQRIVLSRLQNEPRYSHNPLQGGYQEQQDALTTCFTIEETINHCCEENEKVFVAFMDISKAFDTMWINAMLYKLFHNKGISGKVWRLIRDWYTGMKEFLFIEGKSSRSYRLEQGTRQGGVLSPWLFLVFIINLIEELHRTNAGISLHRVYLGSPMFADNLTMLTRVKSGLDTMLYSAWRYSDKWKFKFNSKKTILITFGENQIEHNMNQPIRKWKLGP